MFQNWFWQNHHKIMLSFDFSCNEDISPLLGAIFSLCASFKSKAYLNHPINYNSGDELMGELGFNSPSFHQHSALSCWSGGNM